MRQKKSEDEQHYYSRDDYDHISSSSSSSYIQLRNNHHHHHHHQKYLPFKSKHSLLHFTHIRLYLIIFLFIFLFLLLSFFIFFPLYNSSTSSFHSSRLKRQISSVNITFYKNDKQHYTAMLRRILSLRSSSVPADCSINMASDGIYRLPLKNTLSSEIIQLVEKTFHTQLSALKRTANNIRQKLNQSSEYIGDFGLEKSRDDFRISLRLLLASQLSIKQIALMLVKPFSNDDNGGSYIYYDTIKYIRTNNQTNQSSIIDYDSVHDIKLKQNGDAILHTFTSLNARETWKQMTFNNYSTINNGWWIGPVLCEKNKNETFLMAHIFPLTDSYFLVSYFNISTVDINQCANIDEPFGETHRCPVGTKCIFQSGRGFTLGAYECSCSTPVANTTFQLTGHNLEWNETAYDNLSNLYNRNLCICNPDLCRTKTNKFLRTITLVIQSIFIIFVAIIAAIVFQRRKTKIIKHSMWILLELVLLGAGLLYASVIADSFGPHGIVCLIMPWLRELGFIIVYGTLILRIYKMLAEFQSRKAHCVQVKEKDMLRILSFLIISITGYLLGWTLVNIDHANENISLGKYLLGNGHVLNENVFFQTCRPRSWDYLAQFAEFIFLCVGIRFIYSTRTAPCEYHERKLITIVIVCEMIFSTLLHVIKDILWSTVSPDAIFLLSVLRCHFTVTIMIVLIFCTKLCYIFRLMNEEYTGRDRFRSVPDGVEPADLVAKLHSNGDVDFGELNLRDMDPEEIRAELKRLYTSLHVLKTKTMRKDNPHLTKRHGQRRKHRRFSMQAFQRHGGTHATPSGVSGPVSGIFGGGDKHDHDPTKTPEDSTGSHTEHAHLAGLSIHRASLDESDDAHGRTLSDLTNAMASSAIGQRVTFK